MCGTFLLQEQTAFVKGQGDLFNIQIEGSGKFQKSKGIMCQLFRQSLYLEIFSVGDLIADCFTCQGNGHWKGWERSRADTVAGFLTNMTIEEGEKYDKYDEGGEGEDQLSL